MWNGMMAGVALALAAMPGAATAQDGVKFDCVTNGTDANLKASIGAAMTGAGDEASRDLLFKQLATVTDGCVARHSIAEAYKADYFDYSLARISREWLIGDLAKANLSNIMVDKALDFGPGKSNPDLSADMSDDQIMSIVQAYIDSGVNIDAVEESLWEKVGAYAAATSIYWNKREALPF